MTLEMPVAREELASDAFFQDPYPFYRRMRAHGHPFWLSHQQHTSSGGLILFSSYAQTLAILTSAQGVSKNLRSIRAPGTGSALDTDMLHSDGADHLRLRRLVSEWFSVQAGEGMRTLIASTARQLLTPLQQNLEFDFVAEFANVLPVQVIATLIGVPLADTPQIRTWSVALAAGFDSMQSNAEILAQQQQAAGQFMGYIKGLIATKRAQPDNSLLGQLVQVEGKQLSDEELISMVSLLLFAGHITTVHLIGSALWLLLSHPQAWAALCAQPELVPGAVEEALRFESPIQRSSFRIVSEPLTIEGHTLEPGQQIGVILASANRDEAIFSDSEVFDIRRQPNRHLSFGLGLHNCLGKTLARIEAQVALQVVLELMPGLTLLDEHPTWRRNSFFRGLQALRLSPGQP